MVKLNKSQGKKIPLKGILLLAFIIIVLMFITRNYLSDQWTTLLARSTEDTRTQQIVEFFQQVDINNLVVGGGYTASYSWLGRDYEAIDNQILLSMFRYGIIVTMLYLAIFIVPIFDALKKHRLSFLHGINMMWLLSMAGLSIYCAINIDVTQMVVLIVAGHNIRGKQTQEGTCAVNKDLYRYYGRKETIYERLTRRPEMKYVVLLRKAQRSSGLLNCIIK